MKRKRGYLAPLIIGVVIALAMIGLGRTSILQALELRLLDLRFVLRDKVLPGHVPVSKDIVLVLVDQPTLEELKEPIALWLPYWGKAFKAILDGGATAIGLDYVLGYAQEQQLGELGATLLSPPEGAKPYTDRLVLIGFLENDELSNSLHLVKPVESLVALIGAQNVALANMTRDSDGVPRAQQVVPFAVDDRDNPAWSPLAALLAEKHTGRKIELATGSFGDEQIPLIDGRLLINFTGAQPPFRRISFKDVIAHAADAAWMKSNFDGKVVLMGPGAMVFQDIVATPFSAYNARSMLGIEAQANVLNTLLTGAYLKRASKAADGLLVLVVSLIAAFLAWHLSVSRGALVSLLLMVAVFKFGAIEFVHRAVWVEIAPALLSVPLVWGATYARRYAVEEKEKRHIRDLFGKYVASEVMEELLADPENLKLGGERREVTVFFSDINGFTSTSESRPPEEVVGMLNAYLDEMTRIVFKHKGTLEQFVGDEIMVVFGAPQPHPRPEVAAIETALDMVDRLDELRVHDREENDSFYHIKVGIHTGRPIIGNIGTAQRVQYTCIGDMVNLASRIMGMTKTVGGTILISERTYERVKDMPDVEFIDHGAQEVRGRQNTVRVYEVLRKKNSGEVRSIALSSRSSN